MGEHGAGAAVGERGEERRGERPEQRGDGAQRAALGEPRGGEPGAERRGGQGDEARASTRASDGAQKVIEPSTASTPANGSAAPTKPVPMSRQP